ncbi:MAG: hypothetical protein ACR2GX_08495 [Candidatus Dormibacteria bacterium]
MDEILISFVDGEILHAEISELTFEHPLLEAEVRGVDPNNERALFPLSAIRQLILGTAPGPNAEEVADWDRAAFHFADGQVLRASIAPDAMLGRYGGIWQMLEPGSTEVRILGIPYTALKGVFQVRQWDSRPPNARSGTTHIDRLAQVLAEREGAEVTPRRQPLISRVRRSRS